MFRPVQMKRLRILTLSRYKYPLLKRLHELGAVQLVDASKTFVSPEWAELVEPCPAEPATKKITAQVVSFNRFLDLFNAVAPLPKDSAFKMIFNPSPPKKIAVENIYGTKLLDLADKLIEDVTAVLGGPDERLKQITSDLSELSGRVDSLAKIRDFRVDLADVVETDLLAALIGVAPKERVKEISSIISELTGEVCYIAFQDISETESAVLVVSLSGAAKDVSDSLRRLGFERIDVSGLSGTPADALSELSGRVSLLRKDEESVRSEIAGLAGQWRDNLLAHRELLMIERDRLNAETNFVKTADSFILDGWVPARSVDLLRDEVPRVTEGFSVMEVTEPDTPPEEIPVAYDNPPFFRHFEVFVDLYGRPKYNEMDPTILFAPAFLLFFATCLTDACYGIIVGLLGLVLLRGGGRYSPIMRDFGVIGISMGVATVICGGTSGGFLGDFFLKYMGLTAFSPILFDSLLDVQMFLVLVLTLGLIHLNLGLALGSWKNIRRKEYKAAIGNQIWLFFLQAGVALLLLGIRPAGAVLLILGLAMAAYVQGAVFYFGITGFLGDFLSYARLMATGLATTAMAVTVNLLAFMVYGIPYIGVVAFPVVFVFGHIMNTAINTLGGSVAGLRLHYIEMFNKFYEGGGAEYRPFRISRELTIE
ncbi:MAG: V-type ATP synthase subunit I [Methanothrix sp.]|nr:V-type ATP synthase subunit I [Methanothrix sp.]